MSYISAKYIENLAEKILVEADVNNPPVKADNVAEFTCGLEIEWRNLDRCEDKKIVLAAIDVRKKKICMNESQEWELRNNRGRMNFTVAHELGHWLLHKDFAQEKLVGFEDRVLICRGIDNRIDDRERQANLFAVYLLMPERFIRMQLEDFPAPLSEYDLRLIADAFCVSKQAMRIRLVDELKLLHYTKGSYYKSKLEAMEAAGQQSLF